MHNLNVYVSLTLVTLVITHFDGGHIVPLQISIMLKYKRIFELTKHH